MRPIAVRRLRTGRLGRIQGMAKQGEIEYLAKIGPEAIRQALRKPFSDPNCPVHLMELGAILSLLPPPPTRLLDVGCGTGWTTLFYAKSGHDAVGVDIAPDMIEQAQRLKEQEEVDNVRFVVFDYEEMPFDGHFDVAVFYDALHHAVDENLALRSVYRALAPGGICVTSEPGEGHADNPVSLEAVRRFGVTEKDMPPSRIIAAGRKAGFRDFRIYPHTLHLLEATYRYSGNRLRPMTRRWDWVRRLGSALALARTELFRVRESAIVVLVK
jgi:ubiquinone/menaquinone biosynthesis C-methylase UbiE